MEERGVSQSELARRIGVSQTTIWKLLKEPAQGSKFTHRIAAELKTSAEYLMDESDDPSPSGVADSRQVYRAEPSAPTVTPEDFGMVSIKEIDLDLGAGSAYLGERAINEIERWFPGHWLREFTDAPPDMLRVARVRGTSMKPTIDNGAFVFIDLRRQRINEQDEIWAVGVADIGMVKRIWANADGSYKIKSDNPAVGPETAVDGEMYVIGRVVGGLSKY